MDLALFLSSNYPQPKFEQLAQALKERIVTGALQPGSPLPPTRDLSQSLGVSRGTVVKAYDTLIAQGYLVAVEGSGTFVRRAAPAHMQMQTPGIEPALSLEAKSLMSLDYSQGISGFAPALNYGAPPQDLLPVRHWKDTLIRQTRRQELSIDCSPENLGDYNLRQEIALFLGRSRGIRCQPEQIVIFTGAQQALSNIARVLVEPQDVVVLENPGYGGARDNFAMREAQILTVDVDRDGIKTDDLIAIECPVKLVYVSPSHHDPTGSIMSLERRQTLLSWASQKNTLIIEDAWDSDYIYGYTPLPSLYGLDQDHRVIYVYTFWKTLFPLSSASCIVLPPYLVPIFERIKLMTDRYFPVLEHRALADFLSSGKFERHLNKTKKLYEKRRKALIEALFINFKTDIEIEKQSAGLHLRVRFAAKYLSRYLEKSACDNNLMMASTADYYRHGPCANEYLIPFAQYSDEDIPAKIERFAMSSQTYH